MVLEDTKLVTFVICGSFIKGVLIMSRLGEEALKAVERVKAGQPLRDVEEEVPETAEPEVEVSSDEEVINTQQETEPDNSEAEEAEVSDNEESADADELWVEDSKGRRLVKIDYSNKDQIKEYAKQAYRMRKFQRERDQIAQWKQENEPKLKELQSTWQAVESTYKQKGVQGLVDLVLGEEGAYDKHVEQVIERYKQRQAASPEELARLDAAEEAERIRRENEQIRQELKKQQEEQAQAKQESELRSLQQRLNPAYAKWSFDGKLGDSELEEQYNTALWELSMKKLKSLPETEELTQSVINSTFQEVASRFNKAVATQTKKKVAQSVQKRKDAAVTRAAQMASTGARQSSKTDEFKQHVRSGNIVDSLRMFMNGDVKIKKR